MASFNRVIIVGNVTRDPELRYLGSGTAVVDLGIAVNDRRKDKSGEWVEDTTFLDVTLWARTAEVASEYLSKGSPVLIEGRLKRDTWEKDGQKFSKVKIIGERMQLLGGQKDRPARSRPTESDPYSEPEQERPSLQTAPSSNDDIPW